MRRFATLILFISLAVGLGAETLRGPLGEQISVTPTEPAEVGGISLETVVLVDIAGDPRFLDAIDLELTSPGPVDDVPGAVSLYLLGPVDTQQRAGIIDVVGERLLMRPLQRAGKSFYQIVLRDDAAPDASPAITRIEGVVEPASFPIAISIVPRMKGLSDALQSAEFRIAARPVTRDLGAIEIRYLGEDAALYDPDGSRAPEFTLSIDGRPVPVQSEHLLEPGLHRIRLNSERFQDQEVTVGVERGRTITVDLPLELALATVVYTAPRGSSVYVNGEVLDAPTGDFTVPPGEHTIVVVLGDYTQTRTFRVEERRTYSISLTMDIVVEEIK
jgi:hypothetical protein